MTSLTRPQRQALGRLIRPGTITRAWGLGVRADVGWRLEGRGMVGQFPGSGVPTRPAGRAAYDAHMPNPTKGGSA